MELLIGTNTDDGFTMFCDEQAVMVGLESTFRWWCQSKKGLNAIASRASRMESMIIVVTYRMYCGSVAGNRTRQVFCLMHGPRHAREMDGILVAFGQRPHAVHDGPAQGEQERCGQFRRFASTFSIAPAEILSRTLSLLAVTSAERGPWSSKDTSPKNSPAVMVAKVDSLPSISVMARTSPSSTKYMASPWSPLRTTWEY